MISPHPFRQLEELTTTVADNEPVRSGLAATGQVQSIWCYPRRVLFCSLRLELHGIWRAETTSEACPVSSVYAGDLHKNGRDC